MEEQSVYQRLADHLGRVGMGYPIRETLLEILRENFSPAEAEIALALPAGVIPFSTVPVSEIGTRVAVSPEELEPALDRLAEKGLLYAGPTSTGEKGFALLQVGFGFPQTFFWKGEDTPHARKMALLVAKYFNREVTSEAYGGQSKQYRYIPVEKAIKPDLQAVFPVQLMEQVIAQAGRIAVAHCPCRVSYRLVGRGCAHPTEVCLKFDELADFVIDKGLARELTREEALDVIRVTEEAGLVHFVDNAEGEIKHNCNCCGCACWNVGNIRRRKIPRDAIMATYFMRETDSGECLGCGACATICPVEAVQMKDGVPILDRDWCIGCGVCATVCPTEAVVLKGREDRIGVMPAATFRELHQRISEEKKAKNPE
ncbi:MAG TPA: 4Fe-4S binding protein [Thermodesulfobacteriota bacterium]|nr:4Fe-4S binding protein [Thermodesulfobacteriota bacterium]